MGNYFSWRRTEPERPSTYSSDSSDSEGRPEDSIGKIYRIGPPRAQVLAPRACESAFAPSCRLTLAERDPLEALYRSLRLKDPTLFGGPAKAKAEPPEQEELSDNKKYAAHRKAYRERRGCPAPIDSDVVREVIGLSLRETHPDDEIIPDALRFPPLLASHVARGDHDLDDESRVLFEDLEAWSLNFEAKRRKLEAERMAGQPSKMQIWTQFEDELRLHLLAYIDPDQLQWRLNVYRFSHQFQISSVPGDPILRLRLALSLLILTLTNESVYGPMPDELLQTSRDLLRIRC